MSRFITLNWDWKSLADVDPSNYSYPVVGFAVGEGRPVPFQDVRMNGEDILKFKSVKDLPADDIVLGYNTEFPEDGCYHLVYTWGVPDNCVHCFDLRADRFTGRWSSEAEADYWGSFPSSFTRRRYWASPGGEWHDTLPYLVGLAVAAEGCFETYDARDYPDTGFRWTVVLKDVAMIDAPDVVGKDHVSGCDVTDHVVILGNVTRDLVENLILDDRVKEIWKDDILVLHKDDIGDVKSIY